MFDYSLHCTCVENTCTVCISCVKFSYSGECENLLTTKFPKIPYIIICFFFYLLRGRSVWASWRSVWRYQSGCLVTREHRADGHQYTLLPPCFHTSLRLPSSDCRRPGNSCRGDHWVEQDGGVWGGPGTMDTRHPLLHQVVWVFV